MSRLRALADRGDGTRSFQVETIARVGYRLQTVAGALHGGVSPVVVTTAPRKNRVALFALAGLATAAVAATVVSHQGAASRTPEALTVVATDKR